MGSTVRDPDSAWLMQVARNLLDPVDGSLRHATLLIHDSGSPFHGSVEGASSVWRRRKRAHSGARSELQPARRKIHQNCQDRVPRSLRALRRAAPSLSAPQIRRALQRGALPPGHRWPPHSTNPGAGQPQCNVGLDPLLLACWRAAQLLPSFPRLRASVTFRTLRDLPGGVAFKSRWPAAVGR